MPPKRLSFVVRPGAATTVLVPPGLAVTRYCVTGLLPSEAGALQRIVAVLPVAVAVTPVGAPGAVLGAATGVTGLLGRLAGEAPALL
ncbi:hypothetical protein ASG70_06865 [Phycicoccus sp. Soil748]|nr:hypothetical protein ASG70_06865 [Phycicoccus sp. Soil748]